MRPTQPKQQVTRAAPARWSFRASCDVRTARLTTAETAALVRAAGNGDRRAWDRLVDAYVGLVWAVARGHRLGDDDAHDVSQTTWLRLIENIDRLTDPGRVGAWLAATARRECLCVLRESGRTVPLEPVDEVDGGDPGAVDGRTEVLPVEVSQAVLAAIDDLDPAAEALLRLLILDPPPSYAEISAGTGIPISGIAPSRARSLKKVKAVMARRGIW